MTLLHAPSVPMLAFQLLLLTFCGTGSADEALLIGLKNTSSGVAVSLVPSKHSLSSPVSFHVENHFVSYRCGSRSFRCRNSVVVLPPTNASDSSSSLQYVVLAPVIGAVLIMDWRLSSMKMNLSSYVVKRVVDNECDPLSFVQSSTTVYMVCMSISGVFLYAIKLNTTSISSTTIPGYLSQYESFLSQPLYSNFVYNGETLVYFLDGNSLHSFDLRYGHIGDLDITIDVCDSPYRITTVRGSNAQLIAECASRYASVVIYLDAVSLRSFNGFVYPCTEDANTWYYVRRYSNAFQVEGSGHNTLLAVNGTDFNSAVCVTGDGYNILVTLAYVITEATFKMTIVDGNAHFSTLSSVTGCSLSGCSLEVFLQYILATGCDVLVFLAYNGSISSDPVIDNKQFDSDLIVLLIIPNVPLTPSPDGIASSTTGQAVLSTYTTLDPSYAPNVTAVPPKTIEIVTVTVALLVVSLVIIVVVVTAIVCKKKRLFQTANYAWQSWYTLHSRSQACDTSSQQEKALPIAGINGSFIQKSPENGSEHQSSPEHNFMAAVSETYFLPNAGLFNSHTAQAEEGASNSGLIVNSPTTQAEEGASNSVNSPAIQAEVSGLTVNTAPEEASRIACGMQYLVNGTEPPVPFTSIHPQNLRDQSLSEDHQNTHLSACV